MGIMTPALTFFILTLMVGIVLYTIIDKSRKWKEERYIREMLMEFLEKQLGREE